MANHHDCYADSEPAQWLPGATPGSEDTRLFQQLADVQELIGVTRPRPHLTSQVSDSTQLSDGYVSIFGQPNIKI